MSENRLSNRWVGWLGTLALAVLMVGAFVLVGGFGSDHSAAPLGVSQIYASGDSGTIASVSISNSCASSPVISGSVTLRYNQHSNGSVTLGLFFLSQHAGHDEFRDTGRRAVAQFSSSSVAPYAFSAFTPVPGSPAYVVRVVHSSGGIRVPDDLTESLAIPVCQIVTTTQTATATLTTTAFKTATVTTTAFSTTTQTTSVVGTTTVTATTTTTVFGTVTSTVTYTSTTTVSATVVTSTTITTTGIGVTSTAIITP